MFGTPKEPEDVECALGELPSLLDSREKEISRTLIEKTQKQRNTIRDLRSSLKELVKDLTSKEREEAYHPKLETIAKNTLPLFERAMFSSLSKDLPEDPDLFYLAATESLKGCVKSLSGQGRYLRGVFPEEMKEIRETVDQIGREMNAMTPAIAEARKQREVLSAVRIDLSRLNSAEKEKKHTADEINLLRGETLRETGDIDRLCDRIRAVNEAIDQGSLRNQQEELATAKREFLEKEMALQADLAVVAHVFRKAEKVLGRTIGTASVKDIESFVDTLAGSGIFALFDPETGDIGTWISDFPQPFEKGGTAPAFLNGVAGYAVASPEDRGESFSLNPADGSLECGRIKFFPKTSGAFSPAEKIHLFFQVYAPGGIPGSACFELADRDGQAWETKGTPAAESWNRTSKIWSAVYMLDSADTAPGEYMLKIALPSTTDKPGLIHQLRLTIGDGPSQVIQNKHNKPD